MITKTVKTKNNTYNVCLEYGNDTIKYEIESIDGRFKKVGIGGSSIGSVALVKDLINKIEGRNIFQEELFKKWDGIID